MLRNRETDKALDRLDIGWQQGRITRPLRPFSSEYTGGMTGKSCLDLAIIQAIPVRWAEVT